jgi:hypothetical protein
MPGAIAVIIPLAVIASGTVAAPVCVAPSITAAQLFVGAAVRHITITALFFHQHNLVGPRSRGRVNLWRRERRRG